MKNFCINLNFIQCIHNENSFRTFTEADGWKNDGNNEMLFDFIKTILKKTLNNVTYEIIRINNSSMNFDCYINSLYIYLEIDKNIFFCNFANNILYKLEKDNSDPCLWRKKPIKHLIFEEQTGDIIFTNLGNYSFININLYTPQKKSCILNQTLSLKYLIFENSFIFFEIQVIHNLNNIIKSINLTPLQQIPKDSFFFSFNTYEKMLSTINKEGKIQDIIFLGNLYSTFYIKDLKLICIKSIASIFLWNSSHNLSQSEQILSQFSIKTINCFIIWEDEMSYVFISDGKIIWFFACKIINNIINSTFCNLSNHIKDNSITDKDLKLNDLIISTVFIDNNCIKVILDLSFINLPGAFLGFIYDQNGKISHIYMEIFDCIPKESGNTLASN